MPSYEFSYPQSTPDSPRSQVVHYQYFNVAARNLRKVEELREGQRQLL